MDRVLSSTILAIVISTGLAGAPAASAADSNLHFGRGLDIARIDGQIAGTERKTKAVRARVGGKGKTSVRGEVFVKLPGSR